LSETLAIHEYIAEAFDKALLGKNAKDKATVNMLVGVIKDLRMKAVMPCYGSGDKKEITDEYKKRLPPIIEQLGANAFLVGDYPTYIDFYFFETIQLLRFVSEGSVLKEFEPLAGYCERFKELKGVKDYFNDPFCEDAAKLLNGPIAKINGK